jgi:hypothetical protein
MCQAGTQEAGVLNRIRSSEGQTVPSAKAHGPLAGNKDAGLKAALPGRQLANAVTAPAL